MVNRQLNPASFAYIMATGVVSMALYMSQWYLFSAGLLIAGVLGYFWLVFLFGVRFVMLGSAAFQRLHQVENQLKLLTFAAGSNALAARFALSGHIFPSMVLGAIGTVATVVLIYAVFCTLLFHSTSSIESISPLWLLMAIASNSVGIVVTTLWDQGALADDLFLLGAFVFWSFGVFAYLSLMSLNIYRMFFLPFEGEDINPAYWTCMGAAAIAAFDGSKLLLVQHPPAFLEAVTPFLQGMVLLMWVWGTVWIPLLLAMGIWKHLYFKVPLSYQTSLWAVVFPLGMYTMATDIIQTSVHLDSVQAMVPICLWIAVTAWFVVATLRVWTRWT